MPGDPKDQLAAKYERNHWPATPRPDLEPPDGWTLPMMAAATLGRVRDHTPSPDGRRIAFIWDRDDRSDVYVMDAGGGWPRPVTFDREVMPYWSDDPPQWSPDGAWLAYASAGHAWVVSASGGAPRKVTDFTTNGASPRWLPDGDSLLVTVLHRERGCILLTDREGSWPRPVSVGPGHDLSPTSSPAGRYVAYVHQPLDDLTQTDIMLADLDSGDARPVTDTPARNNRQPCWSPDGSRLAYISDRSGYYELYVFDVATGAERRITRVEHDLSHPAWSPDGRQVLCIINRNGAFDIVMVDAESGAMSDVRAAYGVHTRPQWLDADTITFEYEDPSHPPELFRLDPASGQAEQLTFAGPPALDRLNLVAPERVSYTSFDGLAIPAFLYRPAQPNGAAILYPHGGPTSQYVLEFDLVAQYYVAKGYTWLAPNFRGSTGYGIEFTRANFDVWGVDDLKDCLHGANYLAGLEGIDPARIAIFGASYGSYMAVAALACDPEYRFACGVAKYGDCNILTSWAEGDQGGREDLERMMKHPSLNREAYRAGSPVWQVANIEKPLLIVHGLKDEIVHPLQSEELVEALKRHDKPFEYKTYAEDAHGILHRANWLDFQARMERFLDWHLM
jgi:dipeptidyl aminopeptidase/acylaminoacyl peptidase